MASVNDRKEPSGFSLKAKIFAGAFLTLLLALGFNAMLTLSKLEKLYAESIVSRFLVVGQDLRRSLERSLRLGKSLEKFVGMEPLLDKVRLDLLSEISGEPGLGKGLDRGSVEVAVAGPGGACSTAPTAKTWSEAFRIFPAPAAMAKGSAMSSEERITTFPCP